MSADIHLWILTNVFMQTVLSFNAINYSAQYKMPFSPFSVLWQTLLLEVLPIKCSAHLEHCRTVTVQGRCEVTKTKWEIKQNTNWAFGLTQSDLACLEAVRGPGCGDGYQQIIPESDYCWEEGLSVKILQNGTKKHSKFLPFCRDTVAWWRYWLSGIFIRLWVILYINTSLESVRRICHPMEVIIWLVLLVIL